MKSGNGQMARCKVADLASRLPARPRHSSSPVHTAIYHHQAIKRTNETEIQQNEGQIQGFLAATFAPGRGRNPGTIAGQ